MDNSVQLLVVCWGLNRGLCKVKVSGYSTRFVPFQMVYIFSALFNLIQMYSNSFDFA